MVYDRSDRWLYKPLLSYETDRLCRRLASTKAEVKFAPETKESGSRSVSISHRSDGKNSCDYYYSRADNSGPQKNKTVIEKHCSIVDDGTMPYGWKSSFYDDEIWKLRSPFLRIHSKEGIKQTVYFSSSDQNSMYIFACNRTGIGGKSD